MRENEDVTGYRICAFAVHFFFMLFVWTAPDRHIVPLATAIPTLRQHGQRAHEAIFQHSFFLSTGKSWHNNVFAHTTLIKNHFHLKTNDEDVPLL